MAWFAHRLGPPCPRPLSRTPPCLSRNPHCPRNHRHSNHRNPRRCEHSLQRLLAQRLFGLALGYEDLCDHDRLRDDSLLALALGSDDLSGERRLRERDRGHPLAGSSTLNRLELGTPEQAPQDRYKRIVADPQRLDALLVELFLDSHAAAPEEIVLDVDATDDPLHGRQEGRFFHGYYDCYCYLPLYVTCGPHLLCGRLRRSNRDAADGAVEELQRIVGQIRQRWPRVRVVVRGDAGFCRDELMAWCEAAEGVDYVFGLAQNARLKRALAAVPRFPLSDAGELEPQAAGGGPGGVAAGRGARGQPALRGDQPGAGADRDPAAVRAAVLRARGHGEPHQGAAAGPVRGPDFGGDAAGEPVAAVLGPVRGGAAGGVATTRAGGDGAGADAVRDDPGAAAEGGRGGAGERAEGLGVVVLGVSAPGAVRAQPGAVAGGDAGIACGPAGGVFTLRQFAEQDGQSAPEPVPVDADMATRGDS